VPDVPDVPDVPVPAPKPPSPRDLPLPDAGPATPRGAAPQRESGGRGGSAAGGDATQQQQPAGGAAAPGAAGERTRRPGTRAGTSARGRRAAAAPAPRERRERRLRQTVARLRGCLDSIGATQRRVLVLRAGIGAAAPHSRTAVADRLDTTVRAVRRAERRGLRSLRAACAGDDAAAPAAAAPAAGARTVAFDLGADRDPRGGGTSGTVTGRADEPGQGGVMEEFRSGPGGAPGATLTPPSPGGGDGGPPLLPLIAIGFLTGFAIVWAFERRRTAAT
jgi:hypothetical protein